MFERAFTPTLGAIISEGQLWPFLLILGVGIYVVYDAWQKRKQKKK
ncbi:MAG: hypothetical protein ACYC9Q_09845 [Bacillota bacterium]